jgi:hypothetical protein
VGNRRIGSLVLKCDRLVSKHILKEDFPKFAKKQIMEKSISSANELQNNIRVLQKRSRLLEDSIRERFDDTKESFKPGNLLRSAFSTGSNGAAVKKNLFGTAIGLGLGYLAYRWIAGRSPGMFKKTTARAVQLGVFGVMSKKINLWTRVAQDMISKRRVH